MSFSSKSNKRGVLITSGRSEKIEIIKKRGVLARHLRVTPDVVVDKPLHKPSCLDLNESGFI